MNGLVTVVEVVAVFAVLLGLGGLLNRGGGA